ncbi:MAG: DNA-binding transcriptional LysR family regulator, partial [Thalassolituus oleivorans]
MDYKDLQVFISIAAQQNLGRASQQLHASPSTLSRRLARMEQEAGAILFKRDAQPLVLTPAGELFR